MYTKKISKYFFADFFKNLFTISKKMAIKNHGQNHVFSVS